VENAHINLKSCWMAKSIVATFTFEGEDPKTVRTKG